MALAVYKKINVGCMEQAPQNMLQHHLDIIKQIIGKEQNIVPTSYVIFEDLYWDCSGILILLSVC